MRRPALIPALLACGSAFAGAHLSPRHPRPVIQVALLLDTSNSMDGLINQAKTQLWTFVNEFAPLKRDGQAPELQVALYEYGKSAIPAGEGYIRMVLPFTTDLDQVSQQLSRHGSELNAIAPKAHCQQKPFHRGFPSKGLASGRLHSSLYNNQRFQDVWLARSTTDRVHVLLMLSRVFPLLPHRAP